MDFNHLAFFRHSNDILTGEVLWLVIACFQLHSNLSLSLSFIHFQLSFLNPTKSAWVTDENRQRQSLDGVGRAVV